MRSFPTGLFFLASVLTSRGLGQTFNQAKERHQPLIASNSDVQYLARKASPTHFEKALNNILIPRVVGTENHTKVFNFIVREMNRLKWEVEIDEFEDRVPILGRLTFKNVVATLNPFAERFLVLACHYDSKYFKDEYFVGATDSAVPCAMMLNLAHSLAKELSEMRANNLDSEVSLKMIFFDGEEAFENWGPNDSIYGAKHLAQAMQSKGTFSKAYGGTISDLDRIDVLVLLDIIGAANPSFNSFFQNTDRWFKRLSDIEKKLHRMGLLKNHNRSYFKQAPSYNRIEDDHIPFLIRNVPVLHLISTPFPREWHTPRDDRSIIDMDSVDNLNLILKVFISEYLHLYQTSDCEESEYSGLVLLLVILLSCLLMSFLMRLFWHG